MSDQSARIATTAWNKLRRISRTAGTALIYLKAWRRMDAWRSSDPEPGPMAEIERRSGLTRPMPDRGKPCLIGLYVEATPGFTSEAAEAILAALDPALDDWRKAFPAEEERTPEALKVLIETRPWLTLRGDAARLWDALIERLQTDPLQDWSGAPVSLEQLRSESGVVTKTEQEQLVLFQRLQELGADREEERAKVLARFTELQECAREGRTPAEQPYRWGGGGRNQGRRIKQA